ncbi:hypothetical protein GDO86_014544 [Hymenochirus boettgeri]|uniref:Uncharacterized protein n=1 Tax=Hymenochirus boettgeri TaxID=247094 RepID=A0A8T2JXP0_9PIPI|nr:hypothetical protein GDO86_014544 [Hymenochirus boettgeri]
MNSEEEFFDAETGLDSDNSSGEFADINQRSSQMTLTNQLAEGDGERGLQENGVKKHRTTLPAPMFSRNNFSIWSILKKCIGLVSKQ